MAGEIVVCPQGGGGGGGGGKEEEEEEGEEEHHLPYRVCRGGCLCVGASAGDRKRGSLMLWGLGGGVFVCVCMSV